MTSYTYDPIHILNTSNTSSISGGGSFAVGGGASIGKNLYVGGNLSISGTTTAFSDNIIVINQNPETSADAGILLQRYSTDITDNNNYAGLIYSESTDEFVFGYAESDPSRTSITFNNLIPIKTNKLMLVSTDNTTGLNSGGSLTVLGGATFNKSLYVGDGVTTNNLYITGNIYKNGNVFSGQSQWSNNGLNIYYTEGNVGIGTSVANYTLDVTGTLQVSTGITSANANITTLSGTNSTFTNMTTSTIRLTDGIATNISTGTLIASTGISSVNANITTLVGTNSTFTNTTTSTIRFTDGIATNISTGTLIASTGISSANANITTLVGTNSTFTNTTTSTIRFTDGIATNISTGTLLASTGITSSNANITTLVGTNSTFTNTTTSTIRFTDGIATNISTGTLIASTGISSANANITTLVGTNSTFTNTTTSTIRFTDGIATNISTGTLLASTGITSSNANITTLVGTNSTFTNTTTSTIRFTDGIATNISTGTLIASTGISSANANITNINVTNITIGNIQDLTISGNLTVQGSTTTIVAETVTLDDNLLVLNSLPTASVDGGLLIKRYVSGTSGTTNYAGMFYKESSDEFAFAMTNNEPGKNSVFINNYLPIRANNINLESTENSTSITNGGALTIPGGASITKDLYVGQGITAASAQITTLTGTNIVFTNITTSTVRLTNGIATNMTTSTLQASTGITSATAQITTLSGTNSAFTNITATSAILTSARGTNANFTNITSTNLYIPSITGGSLGIMYSMAINNTSGYAAFDGFNENVMGAIPVVLQLGGGNVGIGNTAPAYKLDVSGTIYASGDIIALSDVRKKTDITTIDNALKKINNLRGVYFKTLMNEKRNVGVIAQEIEEIIPEVVLTDSNGYKGVAYGNITGVLIQGIKELYDIINLKNTEIDNLKSQMQDILKRLNNANI